MKIVFLGLLTLLYRPKVALAPPDKGQKQGTSESEKPKLSEWDSTTSKKESDPQTAFKMGGLKMKSKVIQKLTHL